MQWSSEKGQKDKQYNNQTKKDKHYNNQAKKDTIQWPNEKGQTGQTIQ